MVHKYSCPTQNSFMCASNFHCNNDSGFSGQEIQTYLPYCQSGFSVRLEFRFDELVVGLKLPIYIYEYRVVCPALGSSSLAEALVYVLLSDEFHNSNYMVVKFFPCSIMSRVGLFETIVLVDTRSFIEAYLVVSVSTWLKPTVGTITSP